MEDIHAGLSADLDSSSTNFKMVVNTTSPHNFRSFICLIFFLCALPCISILAITFAFLKSCKEDPTGGALLVRLPEVLTSGAYVQYS